MSSNGAELQILPSPGSQGGMLLLISAGQALSKSQVGGKKKSASVLRGTCDIRGLTVEHTM